jgi:hypothetical protein
MVGILCMPKYPDQPHKSRVNLHILFLLNHSNMKSETKLILIKTIHTLIWIFFNAVIFYMLYAVLSNKLDKWLWIGYGLFVLEGITLLVFKFFCPLTIMARKYSNSSNDNFDIYLPNWLAKYTKLIYTSILVVIIITIYQLLK